jgi:predicted nucleic acid-binding protein
LLSPTEATQEIENYMISCEILAITSAVIQEALRGIRVHQFSYWDAQVWACAKVNTLTEIYSEDFAVGSMVEGVQFTNPFV